MTTIRELPPVSCTGNCTQGRACDCRADIDDDGPPRMRMTAFEGYLLIGGMLASAAVVVVGVWWLA